MDKGIINRFFLETLAEKWGWQSRFSGWWGSARAKVEVRCQCRLPTAPLRRRPTCPHRRRTPPTAPCSLAAVLSSGCGGMSKPQESFFSNRAPPGWCLGQDSVYSLVKDCALRTTLRPKDQLTARLVVKKYKVEKNFEVLGGCATVKGLQNKCSTRSQLFFPNYGHYFGHFFVDSSLNVRDGNFLFLSFLLLQGDKT